MSIGDTYSWTPVAFEGSSGIKCCGDKISVLHGRVVYINERHRYFTVEADAHGCKIRESFKF